MEASRNATIAEWDDHQPDRSRTADDFLACTERASTRYLAEVAGAVSRLGDDDVELRSAANRAVRLTRQFLDAQRTIVLRSADTDGAARRAVETAMLETAVLGASIDDMLEFPAVDDLGSYDAELRALLEAWWARSADEFDASLTSVRRQCAQWVEVARLASDEAAPSVGQLADALPATTVEVARHGASPDLPVEIAALVDGCDPVRLGELLDQLDDVLESRSGSGHLAQEPTNHQTGSAPGSPEGERFAAFWGAGAAGATARRSVLREAIVPMLLVAALLVVALLGIG